MAFSRPMVVGTVGSPRSRAANTCVGAGLQRRVVVHRQGEAGVGGGVFVGAVDGGVVGQGGQPAAGWSTSAPACLRTAARSPARTGCRRRRRCGRRRRSRRCGRSVWPPVSITSKRVSPSSTTSPSATSRSSGAMRVTSGGPDDGRAGGGLDLGVAAGVVGVPVGVEDQVERPAQPLQLAQDRRRRPGCRCRRSCPVASSRTRKP